MGTVPYTFSNKTGNIPLAELDANFANVKATVDTAATVTASAQPNITAVGLLNSLTSSGNIRGVNVLAEGYYWANGQPFTSSPSSSSTYGNSNVASYLPTYTGSLPSLTGVLKTTGDVYSNNAVITGSATIQGNLQGGNVVTNGKINATGTITGGQLVSNGSITGGSLTLTSGGVTAYGNVSAGNITTAGNVIASGRVQATAFLTPGLIQGSDLYSTGVLRGANLVTSGSAQISGSATVDGNISVSGIVANANISGQYFIGNGSLLTGITAIGNGSTLANTLVGNVLSSNVTVSSLTSVGNLNNLTVNNTITAAGNITGAYILGNGSQLTGLPTASASTLSGNTLSANVTNSSLTSVGTLNSLNVNGNITSSGNVQAQYFLGNGSQLTGVTATNVSANALTGYQLSSNVLYSSLTSVGTLTGLSVAGDVDTENITVNGRLEATGNLTTASGNIQGGNLATTGKINATGTITGGQIISNGSIAGTTITGTLTTNAQPNITSVGTLTSLNVSGVITGNGAGITGVEGLSNGNSNVVIIENGNVSISANGYSNLLTISNETQSWSGTSPRQIIADAFFRSTQGIRAPNIFARSNIYSTINDGVIQAGEILLANGNASIYAITGIFSGNVTANNISGNLTANSQAFITQLGTLANLTVSGNASVGNLSSSGNITGTYLLGNGAFLTGTPGGSFISNGNSNVVVNASDVAISANGDDSVLVVSPALITVDGNIAAGNVTITGNVTANYFIGDGSQLTGLPASYGNANVANYLPTYSGNITAGNITVTNDISVDDLTATGNVTGTYILGNGALLTGISTTTSLVNGTSNVIVGASSNVSISANGSSDIFTVLSDDLGWNTGNPDQVIANAFFRSTQGMRAPNFFARSNVYSTVNDGLIHGGALVIDATGIGNGNILAGNVSATGNVSAAYLLGNITLATGYTSYGNANVADYIESYSGNISAGNVTVTGNVSATYLLGDITLATGYYSNANVANYLPTYSGNITAGNVSATGNVDATYFVGNGSALTGLPVGTSLVNGNSNVIVTANGNVSISANGSSDIFTVFSDDLGWNTGSPRQVIVDAFFRSTQGMRAPNFFARSNVYSTVNDGVIDAGSVNLTLGGSGNGNVTAVGVNSNDVLSLNASNGVRVTSTAPFRLPSMTNAQRNAFSAAAGDVIWNTDAANVQVYNGSVWGNITLS